MSSDCISNDPVMIWESAFTAYKQIANELSMNEIDFRFLFAFYVTSFAPKSEKRKRQEWKAKTTSKIFVGRCVNRWSGYYQFVRIVDLATFCGLVAMPEFTRENFFCSSETHQVFGVCCVWTLIYKLHILGLAFAVRNTQFRFLLHFKCNEKRDCRRSNWSSIDLASFGDGTDDQ